MSKGALEGIRVLDLGRIQAAPYCGAILGDMGADVIKIERPGTGDDARSYLPEETYFACFNRSKRGMTLDLKRGRDVFLRLAERADVLIENFRPGVMKRLGLDHETLRQVNPGLIYCSISAFGQQGPYREKAGFDPLIQAMTGMMSVTGFPETGPVRTGIAVCDILGGLNAAVGILAALHHRQRTGLGQYLDIALADGAISAMSSVNQAYLTDGVVQGLLGNSYGTGAPGGVYEASDGAFMYAGANDTAWRRVCDMVGHPEYADDPRMKDRNTRRENRAAVDAVINQWTRQRTVGENIQALEEKKLAAGPILTVEQVYRDPHFGRQGARPMFQEMEHPALGKVEYTGPAVRMSETPLELTRPSPVLGEHNREILAELGYELSEIKEMEQQGMI